MSIQDNNNASKWASKSSSFGKIEAMISLAKPDLAIVPTDFDRNIWLLNCSNGTIDLKTGNLFSHNRDNLITKVSSVPYVPGASAPTWTRFLNDIFNSNKQLIQYIQRSLGYSLTGSVKEQCFFFLHGDGENGKTTLINTISNVLGDYSQSAPADLLLVKKFGGIPNDVARLKGSRFVVCTETEENNSLDEAKIKQLTGGDTITARQLYGEFFEFDPTHKIWLTSNHKPVIKGVDHAIWRRIKLIPFEVRIPEEKRDRELLSKLSKESPGILNWLVQGCLEWQKNGLSEPEEVKNAVGTYRTEMDIIDRFLEECCLRNAEERTSSSELYSRYREWAMHSGEEPGTGSSFGKRLGTKGFLNQHTRNGNVWKGLVLRTEVRHLLD